MLTTASYTSEKMLEEIVNMHRNYGLKLKEEGFYQGVTMEQVLFDRGLLQKLPERSEFLALMSDITGIMLKYDSVYHGHIIRLKELSEELYNFLSSEQEDKIVELIEANGLSSELLLLVLTWIGRPWRIALTQQLSEDILKSQWTEAYCPICGEVADLAFISRGNSERSLGCSSCQLKWPYLRLKCIGCGSTDHQTLKYMYIEGENVQQLQYCEDCKTYIKTFDEHHGEIGESDLMKLDILTAHLDVIAQQHGLKRFVREEN